VATLTSISLVQQASAAPQSEQGTCEIGGNGQGARGCAGNVGGHIENRNGCRDINQGPFNEGEYSCENR
jgi:hypothetical protein